MPIQLSNPACRGRAAHIGGHGARCGCDRARGPQSGMVELSELMSIGEPSELILSMSFRSS